MLTTEPLLDDVAELVVFSDVLLMPELLYVFGVLNPDEGLDPGACWTSLPCSWTSLGPIFWKCFRSCGVISLRTRSFAGSVSVDDE